MSCWPTVSAATDRDLVRHRPIVAAAFTTEDYHQVCTELFAGLRLANRRLLLPATVSAEAGYLIDKLGGPERESGFLAGVSVSKLEHSDDVHVSTLRQYLQR